MAEHINHKTINIKTYNRIKSENRNLRETCEILGNQKVLNDIKVSLDQIRKGKKSKLSIMCSCCSLKGTCEGYAQLIRCYYYHDYPKDRKVILE